MNAAILRRIYVRIMSRASVPFTLDALARRSVMIGNSVAVLRLARQFLRQTSLFGPAIFASGGELGVGRSRVAASITTASR